jgi:hypothetical protein
MSVFVVFPTETDRSNSLHVVLQLPQGHVDPDSDHSMMDDAQM